MRELPESRGAAREPYVYRRRLQTGDTLGALGAAVGVGVVVFYIARLMLQRTPLDRAALRRAASGLVGEGPREPVRRP